MISHKQLNLADIFENCQNIFEEAKPKFLSSLEKHITLSDYVPLSITIFMHQRVAPANTL